MKRLCLGFTNPVGTREVLDVFWCKWGVGRGLGVGWCYVCVSCESGFSV